jgi:hypothetical protein
MVCNIGVSTIYVTVHIACVIYGRCLIMCFCQLIGAFCVSVCSVYVNKLVILF